MSASCAIKDVFLAEGSFAAPAAVVVSLAVSCQEVEVAIQSRVDSPCDAGRLVCQRCCCSSCSAGVHLQANWS